MRLPLSRHASSTAVLAALGLALAACDGSDGRRHADREDGLYVCPQSRLGASVKEDGPALIVTDPVALSSLPLEEVLKFMLQQMNTDGTPHDFLARMFDTANDVEHATFKYQRHCDSENNPAYSNGPPAECPRPEGGLANKAGYFTPGDPDHFYPVAAVNRLDLALLGGGSCGEARIIYAKESGLTNPEDRVFLIFEAALVPPNGNVVECQKVADFWWGLESKTPEETAEALRSFFFEGLDAGGEDTDTPWGPPLSPVNLGLDGSSDGYYSLAPSGQIRLSLHAGGEWQFRQGQLSSSYGLSFVQSTVGNNPLPQLFEPGGTEAQQAFLQEVDDGLFDGLAGSNPFGFFYSAAAQDLGGDSALTGAAINDYAAHAAGNDDLRSRLEARRAQAFTRDCPEGTSLTPDEVLRRATVESCAGCHAPAKLLGPTRDLGCGLVWPESLGEVHIDERGDLSPALKELFLPRRADIMNMFIDACSPGYLMHVVEEDFETNGPGSQLKSLRRRTIGGSTTH